MIWSPSAAQVDSTHWKGEMSSQGDSGKSVGEKRTLQQIRERKSVHSKIDLTKACKKWMCHFQITPCLQSGLNLNQTPFSLSSFHIYDSALQAIMGISNSWYKHWGKKDCGNVEGQYYIYGAGILLHSKHVYNSEGTAKAKHPLCLSLQRPQSG